LEKKFTDDLKTFSARNRKYLTGAVAECLHCLKANTASCGRWDSFAS